MLDLKQCCVYVCTHVWLHIMHTVGGVYACMWTAMCDPLRMMTHLVRLSSNLPLQSIYTKSHKLMEEGKELSLAGLVDPALMEDEVSTLEIAFSRFASQLDDRREVILLAKDLYSRMDSVCALYCWLGWCLGRIVT